MLKGFRLALLSCLIVFPFFQKASADQLKIGYVNLERVFREAPVAIKASKKMQAEFEGRRQDLLRIETDLKARQAAHLEKGASLSDTQRRAKEAELAEITVNFQRKQEEFKEDLKLRQNEETSAVLEKANKAIIDLAKSEKWDLVVQEAVSVSGRIDMTDKVIKKMTGD
jgi:outer membrane protein